jgi:prepilin-type N-terminal cleavage/methylation domain-containing protein
VERRRSERGFTLIEVTMVMVIVGVILAFVIPSLDNISPKYALRAAVRDVASTIDLARGSAAGKGRMHAIRYDLANGVYQLFTPGGSDDEPYGQGPGPWHLWPAGASRQLPRGVRFRAIEPLGARALESGELAVRFDPLSLEGSHIVVLEGEGGKMWSVKYNALLGTADFAEGTVQFEQSEAPQ